MMTNENSKKKQTEKENQIKEILRKKIINKSR